MLKSTLNAADGEMVLKIAQVSTNSENAVKSLLTMLWACNVGGSVKRVSASSTFFKCWHRNGKGRQIDYAVRPRHERSANRLCCSPLPSSFSEYFMYH